MVMMAQAAATSTAATEATAPAATEAPTETPAAELPPPRVSTHGTLQYLTEKLDVSAFRHSDGSLSIGTQSSGFSSVTVSLGPEAVAALRAFLNGQGGE